MNESMSRAFAALVTAPEATKANDPPNNWLRSWRRPLNSAESNTESGRQLRTAGGNVRDKRDAWNPCANEENKQIKRIAQVRIIGSFGLRIQQCGEFGRR
jgi:hypothetical protein